MWIVRLALRRPYTFVVMAIAIALLGSLAIVRTPTDIFPQINIPVVSVIWSYSGMAPDEMEGRIVTICERAMTTTVNSIEHIESQSLERRGGDPRLLPAGREDRGRRRRSDGDQPDAAADHAAGHDAAADHPLLRLERADSSGGAHLRDAVRAAALRLRPELHPHAARHRARCPGAAALRWQGAAGHGRSRPGRAVRQGFVTDRRVERRQRAKRDPPVRHGEDGRHRVQHPHQLVARHPRSAERPPREAARQFDGVPARRGPGARRLRRADVDGARRRPTFGDAVGAEDARRLDARHRAARQADLAAHRVDAAARARRQAAVRSVPVRQSRARRGRSRSSDRGRPDGGDDSRVPRLLALHAGDRAVDPAVDPHLGVRCSRSSARR